MIHHFPQLAHGKTRNPLQELRFAFFFDRDHDAAGCLTEKIVIGTQRRGNFKMKAELAGKTAFSQRQNKPSLGNIMGRFNQSLSDQLEQPFLQGFLLSQIDGRAGPAQGQAQVVQVDTAAQFYPRLSQQIDLISRILKVRFPPLLEVINLPHDSQYRGGEDGSAVGFVVEADIAAGHGGGEDFTGAGNSLHSLDKLPHHLWIFRAAEVQTVGCAKGTGPAADHITAAFGDRQHGTHAGVQIAITAVSIQAHSQPTRASLQPKHGPIASRQDGRIGANHVVILLVDPAAAAQLGGPCHFQ